MLISWRSGGGVGQAVLNGTSAESIFQPLRRVGGDDGTQVVTVWMER